MKPDCILCENKSEEAVEQTPGQNVVANMLYGLLNPNTLMELNLIRSSRLANGVSRSIGSFPDVVVGQFSDSKLTVEHEHHEQKGKNEQSKNSAWNYIHHQLKNQTIETRTSSSRETIQAFPNQIIRTLLRDGLLELDISNGLEQGSSSYFNNLKFSSKGERLVAQKILEEALRDMNSTSVGIAETEEKRIWFPLRVHSQRL